MYIYLLILIYNIIYSNAISIYTVNKSPYFYQLNNTDTGYIYDIITTVYPNYDISYDTEINILNKINSSINIGFIYKSISDNYINNYPNIKYSHFLVNSGYKIIKYTNNDLDDIAKNFIISIFTPIVIKGFFILVTSLILIAHMVWVAESNYSKLNVSQRVFFIETYNPGIIQALVWAIGSLIKKENRRGQPTKFTSFMEFILALMGIATISFLIAVIASQIFGNTINKIDNITSLKNKKIGVIKGSNEYLYLQNRPEYINIIQYDNIISLFDNIKNNNAIFIDEKMALYHITQYDINNIEINIEIYGTYYISLLYNKNIDINDDILKYIISNKYINNNNKWFKAINVDNIDLTTENTISFLFIGLLLLIACIFFLTEILFFHLYNKYKKKQNIPVNTIDDIYEDKIKDRNLEDSEMIFEILKLGRNYDKYLTLIASSQINEPIRIGDIIIKKNN